MVLNEISKQYFGVVGVNELHVIINLKKYALTLALLLLMRLVNPLNQRWTFSQL